MLDVDRAANCYLLVSAMVLTFSCGGGSASLGKCLISSTSENKISDKEVVICCRRENNYKKFWVREIK